MDINEQKKLHETIDTLVRKANGWDTIEKFFKENPDIQKYYEEARWEAARDNCQSYPVVMVLTIEKLLERIDD